MSRSGRIRKVKANIDMLVNTPQVNDWWWIDAIQMGMPVFAKLGKLTGEQKYFDKMWDMYEYTRNKHGENGMYNQKEGLWWRDQDFDPPTKNLTVRIAIGVVAMDGICSTGTCTG